MTHLEHFQFHCDVLVSPTRKRGIKPRLRVGLTNKSGRKNEFENALTLAVRKVRDRSDLLEVSAHAR